MTVSYMRDDLGKAAVDVSQSLPVEDSNRTVRLVIVSRLSPFDNFPL